MATAEGLVGQLGAGRHDAGHHHGQQSLAQRWWRIAKPVVGPTRQRAAEDGGNVAVSLRIQEAANVAVVTDKQLLSSILSIVGTVGNAMQAVAAVGVLAAAFGIVNTLQTAVYERRREIGIMQAVGATRRTLFLAFMLESGLYGLLGGVLGGLVGMFAAYLFGP